MTKYSIYQDFLKINIALKLDTWGFAVKNGSETLATGGNFATRQDCEKHARLCASQLKTFE